MRVVPVLLTLLAALAAAPAALAQGVLDDAVRGLQDDSVFVHERSGTTIGLEEAQALRERIRATGAGPMYVAILPPEALDEAGGSADAALREIGSRLGRPGVYVLVAGRTLRAGATEGQLPRGVVPELAGRAVERHRGDGLPAILDAFVGDVGAARAGRVPAGVGGGSARGGDGGGGGLGLLAVLALVVGGIAFASLAGSRRRRRAEAAALSEVKEEAESDLVALGEDIRALDIAIELPTAPVEARADYEVAVAAYGRANDAFNVARSPEDLEPVGQALEKGRWAMASAKARLEGRPPPERRPPCFFDPRHGPSTRDVTWSPDYGEPRPVPACEADALRVEAGKEPHVREVLAGGRRTPYWNAPPTYAPYAGGFFGGFGGGLLPGLLMGSMLGSMMMGPGIAFGDGFDGPGDGDFGGDFGGGGFGGGGFGGGDFGGGGGFGGGDF